MAPLVPRDDTSDMPWNIHWLYHKLSLICLSLLSETKESQVSILITNFTFFFRLFFQ
jgi:hypothetical protein